MIFQMEWCGLFAPFAARGRINPYGKALRLTIVAPPGSAVWHRKGVVLQVDLLLPAAYMGYRSGISSGCGIQGARKSMTSLKDREKGFENKFAHDAELKFKAEARRNRLLGEWAAEKMGHEDPAAYAREVVQADFEEAGDEDVFRKVRGDFDAKGVSVSDEELRMKMRELLVIAAEQVSTD